MSCRLVINIEIIFFNSNLENTHVDQLIRAAEKNQSLIFLDISNNNDLNSELLNKLKEVLSFNSLKHHPVVLESIKLPKHISNFLLVNQAKEKYLDYQVTTSKEVNPILAKTRNKVISRNKYVSIQLFLFAKLQSYSIIYGM